MRSNHTNPKFQTGSTLSARLQVSRGDHTRDGDARPAHGVRRSGLILGGNGAGTGRESGGEPCKTTRVSPRIAYANLYYKDPKQLKVTFTDKKHSYPSQRLHLSELGLWFGGGDRWFFDVPRCFRSNSRVFFTDPCAYPPAHPPSLTCVDCGSLP